MHALSKNNIDFIKNACFEGKTRSKIKKCPNLIYFSIFSKFYLNARPIYKKQTFCSTLPVHKRAPRSLSRGAHPKQKMST
jgi:hypothetical protein